jgi:predicted phosphate transport protein (TIGR00153 family)
MRFRLVPTDDRFFALFLDGVRNLEQGAVALEDMAGDLSNRKTKRDAIHELERKGDRITRDTLSRLSHSFVTPFDREDIHAICEGIDDVLDEIFHVADLLFLLEIDHAIPEMVELCEILRKAAASTVALFERFESMKHLDGLLEEIDRLESEGDRVYRRAVARLFREGDPMTVLSWKDIIAAVETAVDSIEDVGNLVESVVVKHA